MTDHFGPLYDWLKIALGAVFVLGLFRREPRGVSLHPPPTGR